MALMTPRPRSQAARDGEDALDDAPGGDELRPKALPRSSSVDLLVLLEELASFDRVGVTRLSRHMGIPAANAYRSLRILERTGFVEQLADTKEYRLTLKLFELGSQVASRTTMRDVAAVEIERLAQQAGTSVNLGVLIDDAVLYVAKVETDELISMNIRPGSRAPATCTGIGKAMLAAESRPLASIVGEGPYVAMTPYSITSLPELESEIAEIRRAGYAKDRQELHLGHWCVAVAIPGTRHAQNGALSIALYGSEPDQETYDRYARMAMESAARIARRIGGLDDMQSWEFRRTTYNEL